MNTVIPDSIEPRLGLKALRIADGHLVSPQRGTRWPKQQRLESECTKREYDWTLVPAPEGWHEQFYIPASFLQEGSNTIFSWPPDPAPPGQTWLPTNKTHSLQGCQCGIYIVDSAQQCSWYMTQGDTTVLCEIAIWGQVIIGDKGARGQYAYPQKIFCAAQQAEKAIPVADDYGVQLEIVEFT